jgi:hypothetical protein
MVNFLPLYSAKIFSKRNHDPDIDQPILLLKPFTIETLTYLVAG